MAEQTRRARLLRWVLLTAFSLNLLNVTLLAFFAPETFPTFWLNGLLFVVLIVSFALMRQGSVNTASLLLCVSLWALVTYYTSISGGVASPAFGFLSLVIIISGILLGSSGAIGFSLLSTFTGIILSIAYSSGWIISIEDTPTPDRLFATQTTIFISLGVLLGISGLSINRALDFARQSEQALSEQNQRLQQEIEHREKAQQEQARLAAILEQTSDMVGIADLQGVVLYLNQAGRKLVDISDDYEITRTTIQDYHPPDVADRILHEAIPAAVKEGSWVGETLIRTKSKGDVPVSQVIIAHYDQDGVVEFISSILRDLSTVRQAEQQRLEFTLEKERFDFFREFLSNMSHDIRTPLTIMQTNLYLVEHLEDPQKRSQRIENIQRQLTLMEKYIDDLITLSRLDHVPDLQFSEVDINALVQDEHKRLIPLFEEKAIKAHLHLGDGIGHIKADEQEMRRVLDNLIENAVNYTTQGGKVVLQTAVQESQVIIRVSDTGIGITADELPHIFDRYYRAKAARKTRAGGSGLGLAIVKRIVEIHGGRIDVASEPGKGTTFSVWLNTDQSQASK